MNVEGASETAEERNAKYTWMVHQIKAMDVQIKSPSNTQYDRDMAKANKARLLKQVPAQFVKNHEHTQRANGVLGDERGLFVYENEDGISGLEWRTRPKVAAKRACVLEVEHDRWLSPERQEELRKERKEKRQKELEAELRKRRESE
mgnify:CR=1 FL=1